MAVVNRLEVQGDGKVFDSANQQGRSVPRLHLRSLGVVRRERKDYVWMLN